MVVELIRVVAIDVALVLALILVRRSAFLSWPGRTVLQSGIALILLEDMIRWAISLAVGFASPDFQISLEWNRWWASLIGTVGALTTCVALLPMAFRRTGLVGQTSA